MTVLLKGPPPIYEVAKLKINGAVEVYALLWESAYKDIRIDQRKKLPKIERRDCGGTSEWSIKGLADVLGKGREKVRKAIKALLNSGFISIDGLLPTQQGSKKRQIRVTHPGQLEARRAAIEIMGAEYLDKQVWSKIGGYNPYDHESNEETVEDEQDNIKL
mgnify:CR=1 FL=1